LERRLAAILAADVVGYSRLLGIDEAGTLAALEDRRANVLEPLLERHRGRVVKLMGDGVLAEFASAVNAVQCAVELQQGMGEANRGIASDQAIVLRVGVNLGDVVVEDGDLFGDGVNVAARLEALAEPAGICISGSVFDQVRGKVKARFEDIGRQPLKNIAEPVQVYRIRPGASAPDGEDRPAGAALPLPVKPSIAVLPFDNLSGDAGQAYLSDGITEDIITELSRFHSLFVIARNSSFAWRGENVDVRRVGRELGVRFVVEGSFRTAGERLRITVQLIEAATGNHLWAERYDRAIGDLFEVQDEVARTIVATLAGRLENAEVRSAARKHAGSLPAYDCVLRGIEHLRGYGADDNRQARELFERAIGLDPSYALAHAYLALALLVEQGYEDAPAAIKDRVLDLALAALRLDPGDGRGHQVLAQAYLARGAVDQAMAHAERSMAFNPNDATAVEQVGLISIRAGRAAEGIDLIRQAMRLNPYHPDWYWTDLAIGLYAAHRYAEALDANRRIAAWKSPAHLARLAACYAQLGRLDEARAEAAELLRVKPDFRISRLVASYQDPADAEHERDGLRKAGLPE
jgi:TolB-like protein/class 3 adenylate cyclase/Tfp pilus assembly protein PilF